jgi:GNAT superfamily N-acetyltransferase
VSTLAPPASVLDWDTEHWGVVTARAGAEPMDDDRASALDEWCRSHRVRFLVFSREADDAASLVAAQRAGFVLVDVRMELTVATTRCDGGQQLAGAVPPLRLAGKPDAAWMGELAATSHRGTRFGVDPHLPEHRVADLYRRWIRRDLERGPGVLVAERDNGPVGYLSTALDGAAGTISLVAVAPQWRNRGVGAELVAGSVAFLAERGADRVDVVTQAGNVSALRAYERAGFRMQRSSYVFHKWY